MSIEVSKFGMTKDGQEVNKYTIKNNKDAYVELTNYGAGIVSIVVPNSTDKMIDVLLGYDTICDYEALSNEYFFGATIGRVANRIENAKFKLNNKEYYLEVNNGTRNCLHGGKGGFHTKVWDAEINRDIVIFSRTSLDGEENFPGNLAVKVSYQFDDNNRLIIDYWAESDKDTIINMTNHSYFNLNGHNAGRINNHYLKVYADEFAESNDECLATGNFINVEGTSFDFREGKKLSDAFDDYDNQQKLVGGFDHSFVIRGYNGMVRKAAEACSKESGIIMNVYTNKPSIHFYSGNFMKDMPGKNGCRYGYREGFCLETQFLPNAMQHPNFPSIVLHQDDSYLFRTIYEFKTM